VQWENSTTKQFSFSFATQGKSETYSTQWKSSEKAKVIFWYPKTCYFVQIFSVSRRKLQVKDWDFTLSVRLTSKPCVWPTHIWTVSTGCKQCFTNCFIYYGEELLSRYYSLQRVLAGLHMTALQRSFLSNASVIRIQGQSVKSFIKLWPTVA